MACNDLISQHFYLHSFALLNLTQRIVPVNYNHLIGSISCSDKGTNKDKTGPDSTCDFPIIP
ncbi:hypothetical protein KNP414_05104 [Paenibacillus mucilaginosus KNP414]|uniref:Uncharacterized protein n=1 Tax=Paenibacillus mucilaginosus (strain KNP414) TaxID=1036673 RepID=F8F9D9_PAEMK|nr:hypothetical protein KNP414_05104 [Paenibacillus mucilaginosus KNP414]